MATHAGFDGQAVLAGAVRRIPAQVQEVATMFWASKDLLVPPAPARSDEADRGSDGGWLASSFLMETDRLSGAYEALESPRDAAGVAHQPRVARVYLQILVRLPTESGVIKRLLKVNPRRQADPAKSCGYPGKRRSRPIWIRLTLRLGAGMDRDFTGSIAIGGELRRRSGRAQRCFSFMIRATTTLLFPSGASSARSVMLISGQNRARRLRMSSESGLNRMTREETSRAFGRPNLRNVLVRPGTPATAAVSRYSKERSGLPGDRCAWSRLADIFAR